MTVEPLTDALRSELEATHGAVHTVSLPRHPHVTVAFIEATRAQFETYFKAAKASKAKSSRRAALERLLRCVIVHPSPAQFMALSRRFPDLLETVGGELIDTTGRVTIAAWIEEFHMKAPSTRLGVRQ